MREKKPGKIFCEKSIYLRSSTYRSGEKREKGQEEQGFIAPSSPFATIRRRERGKIGPQREHGESSEKSSAGGQVISPLKVGKVGGEGNTK